MVSAHAPIEIDRQQGIAHRVEQGEPHHPIEHVLLLRRVAANDEGAMHGVKDLRRCFTSVNSVLKRQAKFISVDEEPIHRIVHARCLLTISAEGKLFPTPINRG